MPGVIDWRQRFLVIPCTTIGLVLSLVAVALSIAQFVVQLQNNVGTSVNTKAFTDERTSHVDAPVLTFCGPQPFQQNASFCLEYETGLKPVRRNDPDTGNPIPSIFAIINHAATYQLAPCAGRFSMASSLVWHTVNFDTYAFGEDEPIGKETQYCVSFSKEVIPSYLGGGAARRLFLELLYPSKNDYEQYTLRLWDPLELRSPLQAAEKLLDDPTQLFGGATLPIPYSLAGTALFSPWASPFNGPTIGWTYGAPWEAPDKSFGPLGVRGGISAIVRLTESGDQKLTEEAPLFTFSMDLLSLSPDVQYPYTDTSRFVTLAFLWNSDTTYFYQEVLAVSNVGMAALLIGTISFFMLSVAAAVDIWMLVEESNRKS